jgi:hypothetical protein
LEKKGTGSWGLSTEKGTGYWFFWIEYGKKVPVLVD